MFRPRPCGCKGQRTCKICEEEFGAWKITNGELSDELKKRCYYYCPLCEKLWPGWNFSSWKEHPNHTGDGLNFGGIKIYLDFISTNEETQLLKNLDEVPWDLSQSGRLKQNYGPKCNFKKKKAKSETFSGFPRFTKFIQDRFQETQLLHDFQTAEQCSLNYTPDRGSSIDPHIDDCWIWGERIPTLSLLSDTCLTLNKYDGDTSRYNLQDSLTYPSVVKSDGTIREMQELEQSYKAMENMDSKLQSCRDSRFENLEASEFSGISPIIRIPMPRRSLIVLYGKPRYNWLHSILRQDITQRRVCITYREFSPHFLPFGKSYEIGSEILAKGKVFWDQMPQGQSIDEIQQRTND